MTPKTLFKLLASFAILLFLTGCIAAGPAKPLPSFAPTDFNSSNYKSKVDNFLVIFDASSSLANGYNGNKKFTIAKTFVDRMNQNVPQLGQNAGLRSFGHAASVSSNNTELFYGMKEYSTTGLKEGLDKVTAPGGCSPLFTALEGAAQDLEPLSGNKVIILVSDGQKANMIVPNTIEYAQKLKDKFGDSLCIYTVLVGDSADGMKLLEEISKIGGCGFSANADNLLASGPMEDFVEKVFLTKTSAPAPKKAKPVKKIRKDSDNDGVFDDNDLCPNTPVGAKVNVRGCWSFGDALFDTNKANIKQNAFVLLNDAYKIFEKNPGMKVILKGHTDSRGSDQYNKDLSQRRAEAVKAYLVNQGIDSARLTCKAYGESSPIATNDTDKGRALNRRVELSPEK